MKFNPPIRGIPTGDIYNDIETLLGVPPGIDDPENVIPIIPDQIMVILIQAILIQKFERS